MLGCAGGMLATAATVVFGWGLQWFPRGGGSAPAPSQETVVAEAPKDAGPVQVEQNWTNVSYDGVVYPDAKTPMQKFRRQTVNHMEWIDEKSGTRMESTVPHEEIILVNAPLY